MPVDITRFTDPACPFAFSAEPVRWRLAWHYGEQLRWRPRTIVLTREPGEAEKLAEGAPTLQRLHGMPIDPAPYPRPASSEPACRAVVAPRLHAPAAGGSLLRRLRVRAMAGGLLDDPAPLAAAASDARSPAPAARALDHKLGGPPGQRRHTAPSYELARSGDGRVVVLPGFNGVEAYEAAIANLEPELVRRPKPDSVAEVLTWAGEPPATAEVAAIAQLDLEQTRAELGRVAAPRSAGAEFYWTAA